MKVWNLTRINEPVESNLSLVNKHSIVHTLAGTTTHDEYNGYRLLNSNLPESRQLEPGKVVNLGLYPAIQEEYIICDRKPVVINTTYFGTEMVTLTLCLPPI